jgi:hypothetical protein
MPPPLEAILMIHSGISFREALDLVAKGRLNLGLPKRGLDWSDSLKKECLRLIQESRKPSGSGSPFIDTEATGVVSHSVDSVDSEESKSSEDNKQVENEQDDEEEDDRDFAIRQAIDVYLSPESSKRKPKASRIGQGPRRLESVNTDSSFLIEPLTEDESIQDTDGSMKDTAGFQFGANGDNNTNELSNHESVALRKTKPKNDDEECTNATEASTVLGGVPSVIYIFLKAGDDTVQNRPRGSNLISMISRSFRSRRRSRKVRLDEDDVESYKRTLVCL